MSEIEIQICPECCGTGMANHYLIDRSERECWKCRGMGEIAVSTNLEREYEEGINPIDDAEFGMTP